MYNITYDHNCARTAEAIKINDTSLADHIAASSSEKLSKSLDSITTTKDDEIGTNTVDFLNLVEKTNASPSTKISIAFSSGAIAIEDNLNLKIMILAKIVQAKPAKHKSHIIEFVHKAIMQNKPDDVESPLMPVLVLGIIMEVLKKPSNG